MEGCSPLSCKCDLRMLAYAKTFFVSSFFKEFFSILTANLPVATCCHFLVDASNIAWPGSRSSYLLELQRSTAVARGSWPHSIASEFSHRQWRPGELKGTESREGPSHRNPGADGVRRAVGWAPLPAGTPPKHPAPGGSAAASDSGATRGLTAVPGAAEAAGPWGSEAPLPSPSAPPPWGPQLISERIGYGFIFSKKIPFGLCPGIVFFFSVERWNLF